MASDCKKEYLLFNPTSIIHYRNIPILAAGFPDYHIRCILNPRFSWVSKIESSPYELIYFKKEELPENCFNGVKAVVLFSAQPRYPSLSLIEAAAFLKLPVIAVEEVYQMMLEQGFVNEYFVPVDRLFCASDYEREKFIDFGVNPDVCITTGCVFSKAHDPLKHPHNKNALLSKLGLEFDKPVATLSLAYLTPSGETEEIREHLLKTVSQGLPVQYQLIVKPHPVEQNKNLEDFIHTHAPRAKIADAFTPIDDILDCTDVLLNRGNSQVVIEALLKGIPVIAIPENRKTFFDGILDEVLVRRPDDIGRILKLIQEKGFSLYEPVLRTYLSLSGDEAKTRFYKLANELISCGVLNGQNYRFMDFALYWEWMGHNRRTRALLRRLRKQAGADKKLLASLARLVDCKATHDDFFLLKTWGKPFYRELLLKSLWIKMLFMKKTPLNPEIQAWLGNFAPRPNREYFIPSMVQLAWIFLQNGKHDEYNALLRSFENEFSFLKSVKQLTSLKNRPQGLLLSYVYWRARCNFIFDRICKNYLKKIRGA